MKSQITPQQITALQKQVSPLVKKAETYQVKTAEDVNNASGYLRELQLLEKKVEDKRLEFTAPLNQSLKAINETFKEIKAPIQEASQYLRTLVMDWRRAEQERIAREEARRRAIQEAHKEKGHDVNAPVILQRPESKIGNAKTVKVWKYKIVDFSKVPDEFKVINAGAVQARLRAKMPVEGIEFYQEEQLAVVGY